MSEPHIMFVGGGTAGHIAPLLAVLEAAQDADSKVTCTYVGQPADLKSPLITGSTRSFSREAVHAGKLHRHLTWKQVNEVRHFFVGMKEAKAVVARYKPDVIFAKGGYSTVPLVVAAFRAKIPIYCHESDAVPGLANRLIARFARTVFTAYPAETYAKFAAKKISYVGQPVREQFYERTQSLPALRGIQFESGVPVVTVIGGSQGARRVNTLLAGAWESLLVETFIVHITGPAEYEAYEKKRQQLPPQLRARLFLSPFLSDELPALFQNSTVVVSRAGGIVAELAASRACTVLIPLSTAAQNHQWANAKVLEKVGAALTIDETQATSESVGETILKLCQTGQQVTAMRAAIGSFDHPQAAQRMAEVLLAAASGTMQKV